MNNIALKSVTNGNDQSYETLKTVLLGNNQTNVLEVQANTLVSAEVNIPTVSIPLTHDSNSSNSDSLISLRKKLLKEKCEKFINFVINRFERTSLCLDLHASIDRSNRFLLYL